jgi:translation initiation factor 2B subunit (eIF-2B alpha/beta/delta family)
VLPADIEAAIARIAADRESGASHLLEQAVRVLRRALAGEARVEEVAPAVRAAQPSMAGVLNAALEAMASRGDPERFERFVHRLERSGAALRRWGLTAFGDTSGPLHVVTISASRSVLTILREAATRRPVHVACAEGRPVLEGQSLAREMTALGIEVTFFTDAAIASALAGAQAVLVGADAVAPRWFLNKVGTRMRAAAASFAGCPFYVAATRDKFLRESASRALLIREGTPAEVWDSPPPQVSIRNPYFESTSLDLITALITDSGILGAGMAGDVCAAAPDDHWLDHWPLPGNGTTQLP